MNELDLGKYFILECYKFFAWVALVVGVVIIVHFCY